MSHTRIYRTWCNMKGRCYRKTAKRYNLYGGRGIKVCDEWKNSFIAFYDWALNNGYQDNLTIDRINVNGNYEPSNCRWVSNLEQQSNRSNNRFITYNNMTKTLSEWARIYNLNFKTLQKRIDEGWSVEKALKTRKLTPKDMIGKPTKKSNKICQYTLEGEYIKTWKCLSQIEHELGYFGNCISQCCLGKTTKSYGFIWCYDGKKPNLNIYKKPQRRILQYDKDMNFIKSYENAYEAGKINTCNHNSIRSVCNGTRKSCKGYIWKYE